MDLYDIVSDQLREFRRLQSNNKLGKDDALRTLGINIPHMCEACDVYVGGVG